MNRVQWFANYGPDNAHWMHTTTMHDTLRDAQRAMMSMPSTWVGCIIRGEDLPYEPGSRKLHKASTESLASHIESFLSNLPGNKVA